MLKELSVTEISTIITRIFNSEELLQNVRVYGEISGFQVVRGHAYFSLKDAENLISCVFFNIGAQAVKEGDQVLLTGRVSYYGKSGKLQIYASKIEAYGQGILYQKFLQLKEKLDKEGLFDPKNKKSLPKVIKTIGVVTSETGAVIQDIINIVTRRNPATNIFIYPSKVQGVGAQDTVIEGINYYNQHKNVDVIVVARGGGSFEDLNPFNDENLARVIYSSSIPVVSAVGHETDFTICDFVSVLRASTPSAAAELLTEDIMSIKTILTHHTKRLISLYEKDIANKMGYIDTYLTLQLLQKFERKIAIKEQLAKLRINNLSLACDRFGIKEKGRLDLLTATLNNLNPIRLRDLGYVKVIKGGKVVKTTVSLAVGDDLNIDFVDGSVISTVKEIKVNKKRV